MDDHELIPTLRTVLSDYPPSPGKVNHTTRVYIPYSFRTVIRYRDVTSNFTSRVKGVSSDQWYGTELACSAGVFFGHANKRWRLQQCDEDNKRLSPAQNTPALQASTEWESRFSLLLVVPILYEVISRIRNCNAKAAFLCCFVVSILWEVIKTVYHPKSLTAELVDWRAERTVGSVIQRWVTSSA